MPLIKTKLSIIMLLVFAHVRSVSAVEFNTDILDSDDKKNIDISRFKNPNFILPGNYFFNILVNNVRLTQSAVPVDVISDPDDNAKSEVCLDDSYINSLGIKEEYIEKLAYWNNGQCLDLLSLSGASVTPNLGEGVININIPQLYLEYSDNNWLPKSLWDEGVGGLIADYNANYQFSEQRDSKNETASISGYIGANLASWRLRGEYFGNYQKQKSNGITNTTHSLLLNTLYLFRNIKEINSKLVIGESTTLMQLIEPIRFTGLALFTDESMLPPRLRGYAPEITGVAKTNARVIVTQLGRVLYDGNVPAGPFKIQSLSSGARGDLDVKIIEQDGSEHGFTINSASVPYLTRPGFTRYNLSVGEPIKKDHSTYKGVFFLSGEVAHGLNNDWSINSAGSVSQDYQLLSIGVGRFMNRFGAISFNVARSFARLDSSEQSGNSYRVSYSKTFDDYNMDLTFAGYRFTDKKYLSLSQFISARDDFNYENEKERYQLTLSKRIGNFNVNVNYQLQQYWNRGQTHQYGVNIGTGVNLPYLNLSGGSIVLSANRSYYQGKYDDQVNLMLTVPFGQQFYSFDSLKYNESYMSRIAVSGLTENNDYYNVSTSTTYGGERDKRSSLASMYDINTRYGSVSNSLSASDNGDLSLGLGFSGGVTATAEGIAFHKSSYVSAARLMVDTDSISGVPINGEATVTNALGIGVIPSLIGYHKNNYSVDLTKLPHDIETSNTIFDIALTEGAIGYRKIDTEQGFKLFASIKMKDGSGVPPFGAQVLNEKGREVGIISDDGLVWLTAVKSNEKLNINWSATIQCNLMLPELSAETSQLLLLCEKQ